MTGWSRTRRWLAIGAAGTIAAIAGGSLTAMAATSPQAAARPEKVSTSDYSVLIGPFRAKDGYLVDVEAIDCGTDRGGVIVDYERGNRHVALDHTYVGLFSKCTVAKNLTSASLKVRWGTVLHLDLTLAGTAKIRTQAVEGCTRAKYEFRRVKATGTDILSIHRAAWGRLVEGKAVVQLAAISGANCTASSGSSSGTGSGASPISGGSGGFALSPRDPTALARALSIGQARGARRAQDLARAAARRPAQSTPTTTTLTSTVTTPGTTTTVTGTTTTVTGTTTTSTVPSVTPDGSGSEFLGFFDRTGSLSIDAQRLSGYTPLTIINDAAKDDPAPGVEGSMDAVLEFPGAFTVSPGDDTAQVDSYGSFVHGRLAFSATKTCNDTKNALDGNLTGKITVQDPIFHTITYNGPTALGAAVGNGDASFESC